MLLLLLSLCGCWCVSICIFIDSSKCYQNHHSRLISPLENKFALPEISCSDILGKTYGYHSDALLWKVYATTMLTCCHGNTPCDSLCLAKFHPISSPSGSVSNLYHHLPSTGLKILLDTSSSEQERRSIASAKWFFRHHIVPPTLTTLTTVTVISAHKRRCLILCKTKGKDSSPGPHDKTKLLARPKLVSMWFGWCRPYVVILSMS